MKQKSYCYKTPLTEGQGCKHLQVGPSTIRKLQTIGFALILQKCEHKPEI